MGSSPSLIEHKEYYDSDELHYHYYTIKNKGCGPYRSYDHNERLRSACNYENDFLSGRFTNYSENGFVDNEFYYNDHIQTYSRVYDDINSVFICTNKAYHKNKSTLPDILSAIYVDEKLYSYNIEYSWRVSGNSSYVKKIIYHMPHLHRMPHSHRLWIAHPYIIDLSVINPIRNIQKRFRDNMYSQILNELNLMIHINDLSLVVISYIKN